MRTVVSLRAVSDAYAFDRVRLAIIYESIGRTIGIAGDEVAGTRLERHIAAVGADRGVPEPSFACVPSEATLTRSIVFVWRSYTKMSRTPLVSPGTRLLASEANAT